MDGGLNVGSESRLVTGQRHTVEGYVINWRKCRRRLVQIHIRSELELRRPHKVDVQKGGRLLA